MILTLATQGECRPTLQTGKPRPRAPPRACCWQPGLPGVSSLPESFDFSAHKAPRMPSGCPWGHQRPLRTQGPVGRASARLRALRPHHCPPPSTPESRGTLVPWPAWTRGPWPAGWPRSRGMPPSPLAVSWSSASTGPSRLPPSLRREGLKTPPRGGALWGLAPRCPRAPLTGAEQGPPAGEKQQQPWPEHGVRWEWSLLGPRLRGVNAAGCTCAAEWAPCALCRVRPARHAHQAPRSVPSGHGGQTGSPVLLYQDVASREFLSGQQPHNYSPLGRGLAHTPWGPANISSVYSSCGCQESPGVSEGVSPAPSASLRGACLGVLAEMLGSPQGTAGGAGSILTWTLVPETAPACQAHPTWEEWTLGGTSRGQHPPLGVLGGGYRAAGLGLR